MRQAPLSPPGREDGLALLRRRLLPVDRALDWGGLAEQAPIGVLLPAAVLVPLLPNAEARHSPDLPTSLDLLFAIRAAHLARHPGQIGFPGGRREAPDRDPVATALRETEEEMGIARAAVEVLGCLPALDSRSGYRIWPVVGLLPAGQTLHPDPGEVERCFTLPLGHCLDLLGAALPAAALAADAAPVDSLWAPRIPLGEGLLWGVTSAILCALYRCLREPGA